MYLAYKWAEPALEWKQYAQIDSERDAANGTDLCAALLLT